MDKRDRPESGQGWPETGQQGIDYINHVLERFDQRITLDNLRLAKRYVEGELHLLVWVNVGTGQFIAHLKREHAVGRFDPEIRERNVLSGHSFDSIRSGVPHSSRVSLKNASEIDGSKGGANGQQEAVFVDVIKLVDSPDDILPTTVWLGCVDCIERILPRSLYFSVSQGWIFAGAVGDGVLDFPGLSGRLTKPDTDSTVRDMIESASQVVQNIPCDTCNMDGYNCDAHDAIRAFDSAVRIYIGADFIGAGIKKGFDGALKLLDVAFGPFNFRPWAGKRIGIHEEVS